MPFVGLRLSDRTAQMLDEMAEGSGLTRQEVLRVAVVVLYRLYHGKVLESLVTGDSQSGDKVETVPQDVLRSQQKAQEGVREELDESQDVLEEWRSEMREERRKKREKRKKEKKKRKRR
jgi:biopolymer transport protein ExbB/TolQ